MLTLRTLRPTPGGRRWPEGAAWSKPGTRSAFDKVISPFTLLLIVAVLAVPLSCLAAGYHYVIRDGGFWIHNGPAYFNRPLFGTHEPSMLLSGDRPAFAYFAPTACWQDRDSLYWLGYGAGRQMAGPFLGDRRRVPARTDSARGGGYQCLVRFVGSNFGPAIFGRGIYDTAALD